MNKILEIALKVVRNPIVRKAFVGLVMAILAALGIVVGTGCASLSPAQQRALQAHSCYLNALEPALGELSEPVLAALLAGGNPVQALAVHGLSQREIVAVLQAFSDCAVQAAVAPRAPEMPNPDAAVNL
jgi:hypothetical protein